MKKQVNGAKADTQTNTIDLSTEVTDVLKTLLLLERGYGMNYLVDVLKGESRFDWKADQHTEIETFGCLQDASRSKIRQLIQLIFDARLIYISKDNVSILYVTKKGKAYLEAPSSFDARKHQLSRDQYDFLLAYRLRKYRKAQASRFNLPAYKIFADFTLDRIVYEKPGTRIDLKKVPGLGLIQIEEYGAGILEVIRELEELRKSEKMEQSRRQVQSPTYQQTKKLFNEGLSVTEIAKQKEVSEKTVKMYLERLHQAGEIDLRPWIEKHLDSKALYKGAEYFRQTDNPKLREAYETLGLDYETLRFCKLYVADHRISYEELAA